MVLGLFGHGLRDPKSILRPCVLFSAALTPEGGGGGGL